MQEFADLDDYLNAYSKNSDLAFVPISHVAEHLEMSPAGVAAMVRSGRLSGVRIGRSPFILINSLKSMLQAADNEVLIVENFLKGLARAQERQIFYEPVMQKIALRTNVPAHRNRIGEILGEVSEVSHEEHGVLLSVLVHRKMKGTTRPGPGFFALAKSLHYKIGDPDEFVRVQTDKVLAAYSK